jgi:biotin carboxyl carrier protein
VVSPNEISLSEISPLGETNGMRERLVVAPCDGRFWPLPPEVFTTEGEWVEPGTPLAEVRSGDVVTPVVSACRGWVMGILALAGQPVHRGEALFWVWSG